MLKQNVFLFIPGKVDDPVSLSRWERVEEADEEQPALKENKSKWEKVEGVKMNKSTKDGSSSDDGGIGFEEDGTRRSKRFVTLLIHIVCVSSFIHIVIVCERDSVIHSFEIFQMFN